MIKRIICIFIFLSLTCTLFFSVEILSLPDSSGLGRSEGSMFLSSEIPFNPLRLQTVFLKDLSENVHFIKCVMSFPDADSDGMIVKEHTAYYPVIRHDGLLPFFSANFFWMFNQSTVDALIEMSVAEKAEFTDNLPGKLTMTVSYDQTLLPYYELLKVEIAENTGERNARLFGKCVSDSVMAYETPASGKNAIVFVHGVQGGQFKSVLSNFSETPYGWRNYDRRNYWSVFYDASLLKNYTGVPVNDFDFFEYQYDSYFDTSEGYGRNLALLLDKCGLLDNYENLVIISHSMGTVVSRFALNEYLPGRGIYAGELVDSLVLIGGLLEGSFFSNLADPLVRHSAEMFTKNAYDAQYDLSTENIELLYKLLGAAFDYKKLLFSPENIIDIFRELTDFYFRMPIIAGGLFGSFSDIPFMGGQLVLFPGMTSLRYTDGSFLDSLAEELHSESDSFFMNESLYSLNRADRFIEKEMIFSSHISDENAFLKGLGTFSALAGILLSSSQNPPEESGEQWYLTGSVYPELNIPLIKFMIQRALCKIISDFAFRIGEPEHSQNDGFVTLWSQEMGSENPMNLKITEFTDMDHAQVKETKTVAQKIYGELFRGR